MMDKFWMVYNYTLAVAVNSMRYDKQYKAECVMDEVARRSPGHHIVLMEATKVFTSEVTEPTVTKLEKHEDN